jgi:septum formation protein
MGFKFQIISSNLSETLNTYADPEEQTIALSRMKAESVLDRVSKGLVIGADTVVSLDGCIYGKPGDKQEAKQMLYTLSDRMHTVTTGFTLIQIHGKTISDVEKTQVVFRKLESWEIDDYVETGSPLDKAGGYGIQDCSGLFVDRIEGCFYNVVGFPLTKFYECLKQIWDMETLRQVICQKG